MNIHLLSYIYTIAYMPINPIKSQYPIISHKSPDIKGAELPDLSWLFFFRSLGGREYFAHRNEVILRCGELASGVHFILDPWNSWEQRMEGITFYHHLK